MTGAGILELRFAICDWPKGISEREILPPISNRKSQI